VSVCEQQKRDQLVLKEKIADPAQNQTSKHKHTFKGNEASSQPQCDQLVPLNSKHTTKLHLRPYKGKVPECLQQTLEAVRKGGPGAVVEKAVVLPVARTAFAEVCACVTKRFSQEPSDARIRCQGLPW
jgi:hypothetical protein